MELSSLYLKSGLKNVGIVFLMTDAQVPSESFLVLINDMLSTGEIPELFPDDEVENIIAGVRNEVSDRDTRGFPNFLVSIPLKARKNDCGPCRKKNLYINNMYITLFSQLN